MTDHTETPMSDPANTNTDPATARDGSRADLLENLAHARRRLDRAHMQVKSGRAIADAMTDEDMRAVYILAALERAERADNGR